MLTLKKLFSPEAHDICPNCGTTCAITNVLCPGCGKNLDELFEHLPDSEVIYKPNWLVRALGNQQIIKIWSLTNSIVLAASLLTPWIIFFSDVIVIRAQLHYVFGLQLLLSPLFRLIFQQEFLSSFGSSLLEASAPAIALYYSFHGIRTVRNIKTGKGALASNFIPALFRLLLAVVSFIEIDSGVGFNSYMTFGYNLVIIGLVSAFLLELIVLILGIKRKAA